MSFFLGGGGVMGCVCNIVIINQQFGTTYLSILVN